MFINPFKKIDMDRRKRSSNILRQSTDQDKVINQRLRVTLFVVCLLFAVIVIRLINLQIINQKEYSEKLINYTAKKQSFSSPRGTIYDKEGNILVESVNSFSITYYPPQDITEKEEWELATKVVDEIGLKADVITERQLKELHISYLKTMKEDDSLSVLSKKQLSNYREGKYSVDELYEIKISQTDVGFLDDRTKAIYQVKMKMDGGQENQFKVIAEDITNEQLSYLSENNFSFNGFNVSYDWKRVYGEDTDGIKAMLGKISTQTQGVPNESKDYFLALDYAINDRVGISGLEKTYEQFLSGSKKIYNIAFGDDGIAYLEEEQAGKSGYDLHLTFDIEYQNKMDELVEKTLSSAQNNAFREHFNDLFLVVMNPNTGEIIAMSGASRDDKTKAIYSNPTGTYLNADRAGSVVKLATLYMGLNEKVVSPGQVINDAPMFLKGTQKFASYNNYGLIDDVAAIAKSSNVYMAHIAIGLGGSKYVENGPLVVADDTFMKMRNYFNMFGLGLKTGIDLPNEQIGTVGSDLEKGKILYYAIGQYDTYTTMQLAQYTSTLANGGKRVQPHLLSKVSEVNDMDTILFNHGTNILSTLYGDSALLKRGEAGMAECTNGFCGAPMMESNIGRKMAAKSGTAEDEIWINKQRIQITNSSMIAYGPIEKPEIAVACFAPRSNSGFGSALQSNICSDVIGAASKEYFANK